MKVTKKINIQDGLLTENFWNLQESWGLDWKNTLSIKEDKSK